MHLNPDIITQLLLTISTVFVEHVTQELEAIESILLVHIITNVITKLRYQFADWLMV